MARIQYKPASRSRGFNPQQLSTAGINRMRDESNRIIQNMEKQRLAEQAQRDRELKSLVEDNAYTERIKQQNFEIKKQNISAKSNAAITDIKLEDAQARADQASTQSVLNAIGTFSQTASQALTALDSHLLKQDVAAATAASLQAPVNPEEFNERVRSEALMAEGSIALNTEINVKGVESNENPIETNKSYLSNPGFTGRRKQIYDNLQAVKMYNMISQQRFGDSEYQYTAADGRQFTGVEAQRDQYFASELQRITLTDLVKDMGYTEPMYLKDAKEKILAVNQTVLSQVGNEQLKFQEEVALQGALDLAQGGTRNDLIQAGDLVSRFKGKGGMLDFYQDLIETPSTPQSTVDIILNLPVGKDGAILSKSNPNRFGPALAKRNEAIYRLDNLERDIKESKIRNQILDNMDIVSESYDEDFAGTSRTINKHFSSEGMAVPPAVTALERCKLKRKNSIDEAIFAQKVQNSILDLTFVNSIEDPQLQERARKALDAQEERKYGPESAGIKEGMLESAKTLTKINREGSGSAQTFLVYSRILKEYNKALNLTNDPLAAYNSVQDQIRAAFDNKSDSPFFFKDGAHNRRIFPHIETSDAEKAQYHRYRLEQFKNLGTATVDKPFALAQQPEMDAAYESRQKGSMIYPPGILHYAETFGFKPSEVFNAHRTANNKATGDNKPLLTPDSVTEVMDRAGSTELRNLLQSGNSSQINRSGAAMGLRGTLPLRSSMQSTGMRGLADLISSGEGRSDSMFPGENYPEMLDMTIRQVVEFQKEKLKDGRASAAVGDYQFLYPENAAALAGLSLDEKFTPENQFKMLLGTLFNKPGRENLSAFLQGTGNNIESALDELSNEFSSIAGRDGQTSHKDGVNKASISRDQARAALLSARQEFINR